MIDGEITKPDAEITSRDRELPRVPYGIITYTSTFDVLYKLLNSPGFHTPSSHKGKGLWSVDNHIQCDLQSERN